ncbi:DUF2316 family protein [Loigolactobacillus backii]|uniref:Uncharacterized protein n=1 Tax=Loigolactobacillus backii TaxID=375175 RepID=A0A192H3Q4_9LACO|nr:DUF2316 family protein [Loigolactobacillus backii]ANK59553.1 hypothetical protein AYR52_04395 [Loigolactobacillus backii]ANK62883.1 hypothetical protein AYR53_09000 [Loigolactobacillus backii]ANK64548.1 hypothetical protein AYR54_04410 [Loigolactobacillus backii]ANK67057.1 hypothetical protein AYR55_04630 [Loigolactobacillus backii]ANK70109.1 hypothetical protein AYR56_08005 [Loigolactobacillus backii]
MSLNPQQIKNTINELHENFVRSGLTKEQVASDLNISMTKLDHLFSLTQQSMDDPWILRNYLNDKVADNGQEPVPYSALVGDWHQYWFLNTRAIDKGEITAGDL